MMMKQPLSMTPAAIRSRKYRGEIKGGRERTRGKKPPPPSTKVRGTVFQPWDVGQPTTMRQRIRDLAVAHMIRTSGQNLDYRARQKLLKSFDADLAALDEAKPETTAPLDSLEPSPHDAGIPTDAAPFRHAEAEDFDNPSHAVRDGLTTEEELIKGEIGIDRGVPPSSRSDVVAQMKAQRAAPKQAGVVGQPIYSVETQDASKMRECLAECAKIIADAIVRGAKITAAPETTTEPPVMASDDDDRDWRPVGPGTPLGAWLETAEIRESLGGTITTGLNTCMCRVMTMGDTPEWIEKNGGRTTVTHSTFASPTHWRWPAE